MGGARAPRAPVHGRRRRPADPARLRPGGGRRWRSCGSITDAYRITTMATLRVAFLSALALELLATISVALVAVGVGLRLAAGDLTLRGRAVRADPGARGIPAAAPAGRRVPCQRGGGHGRDPRVRGHRHRCARSRRAAPRPPVAIGAVVVDGVSVEQPGRDVVAPARASLVVRPGEIVAVTGPSGAGKSTLLAVILGLLEPSAGRVAVQGTDGAETDVRDLDADAWRARVAWVPQVPYLFAGHRGGERAARRPRPRPTLRSGAALASVGLGDLSPDRQLGERGRGLSSGQRRRVGLARALVRGAPILLLDEPTAGLDEAAEAIVLAAVRDAARGGAAVLLVAHRPGAVAEADRTVAVRWAPASDVRTPDGGRRVRERRVRGRRDPWGDRERHRGRGMSSILAILRIGRPVRGRLVLAVLAGVAAGVAAIGLAATSAWLISRAAEQPVMLTLLAAITAVRAFGISRGVFRYLERLSLPTTPRSGSWASCAGPYTRDSRRLRPPAWPSCAPGTCSRDSWATWTASPTCGSGSCSRMRRRRWWPWAPSCSSRWLVPAAGLVAGRLSLLATAIVAPLVAGGVSRAGGGAPRSRARRAGRRRPGPAARRARDRVAGAAPRAIGEVRRVDARLAAAERRSALGAGVERARRRPSRRACRCGPPSCSGSSPCARGASAAWPSPSSR